MSYFQKRDWPLIPVISDVHLIVEDNQAEENIWKEQNNKEINMLKTFLKL